MYFRLRLALLSALLSGLVLLGFGATAWTLIRDFRLQDIDQDVRDHAEREARRTRTPEDWRRIEARLVSGLGVRVDRDLVLLVEDDRGRVVYCSPHCFGDEVRSKLPWPEAPAARPPRPDGDRPEPRPQTMGLAREIDGRLWRLGLARSGHARVAVGIDSEFINADMQGVRNAFWVSVPVALALMGLAAWWLSRRAMQPLNKLTQAARRISADHLDQRIEWRGEDREFAELMQVFNGMLERLERSFHQAHRFSADAAHELRTPLTILQGQLERLLATVEAGSPLQAELGSILDEVRRLSTISRKLLLLSRADAGRLNVLREPFDLSKALQELVEDLHLLAPELQINSRIEPGLVVQVDRTLFPQILHNLASNAVKYNLRHGWIEVVAGATEQDVELRFANASSGIAPHQQERLFERFYRADTAHGRNVEGVGLGLSVAREIARAHGGDLVLAEQGNGLVRFVLRVPLTH